MQRALGTACAYLSCCDTHHQQSGGVECVLVLTLAFCPQGMAPASDSAISWRDRADRLSQGFCSPAPWPMPDKQNLRKTGFWGMVCLALGCASIGSLPLTCTCSIDHAFRIPNLQDGANMVHIGERTDFCNRCAPRSGVLCIAHADPQRISCTSLRSAAHCMVQSPSERPSVRWQRSCELCSCKRPYRGWVHTS